MQSGAVGESNHQPFTNHNHPDWFEWFESDLMMIQLTFSFSNHPVTLWTTKENHLYVRLWIILKISYMVQMHLTAEESQPGEISDTTHLHALPSLQLNNCLFFADLSLHARVCKCVYVSIYYFCDIYERNQRGHILWGEGFSVLQREKQWSVEIIGAALPTPFTSVDLSWTPSH